MNISIKTIPHGSQAYPTVGDWRFDDEGNLSIFVSDMGNWKYEVLVAIHELIEVSLCKDRGISTEEVDAFDIRFEDERLVGLHSPEDEPGDAPDAPYRKEHFLATSLERMISAELKVDWQEYSDAVNNL